MHGGAWATQAAPRSSRQSPVVAVLAIGTHTPTPPHVAFPRAPPHVTIKDKGSDPFSKGLMLSTSRTLASVRRLLQRRTARDGQHSDWVGA